MSTDRLRGWDVQCLSILETLKLHSLYEVHGQLSDKIISMYLLMSRSVKFSDGVIMNDKVAEGCSFELL